MSRVLGMVVALFLAAVAYYASPWWPFRWWDRDGLLGIEFLRPRGDLLASATRGTSLAPHELILWGIGVFLVLTVAQKVWSKITGV